MKKILLCSALLLSCARPHYVSLQPAPVRPDFVVPLQGASATPQPVIPAPPAPPAESCDSVDRKGFTWLMVSVASSVLAGSGGLSTIPVQTTTGKEVVAGVSLSVGVFSAISAVAVNYYSNKFKSMSCAKAAP